MRSSERADVPAYETCGHCGQWALGRSVRFGVGWKSRGQNPRTLVTDLRVLKVDAVFVCEACERRLLWRGARSRFGREILRVLPVPALLFALSLWWGVIDETRLLDVIAGIAAGLGAVIWLLLRWRSKRVSVLRELLFESRRAEYGRQLERPALSLAVYPPPETPLPAAVRAAG